MEFDRYQKHHKLYLLGIICLLLCLSLLLFSLYLLPFLIWNLVYNVPEFIVDLIAIFEDKYGYTDNQSRAIVGLLFFFAMLVTGLLSYYVSNLIDNEFYNSELKISDEETTQHTEEVKKDIKESATIGFEIIILMILVVVGLVILQWII